MRFFEEMHSNIDFLPHDPDILVKDFREKIKFIKLMIVLIDEIKNAILEFLKDNVDDFDPHVGDTLCQIRGYKMVLLFSDVSFKVQLQSLLFLLEKSRSNCMGKLNSILNTKKDKRRSHHEKYSSLKDFFIDFDGRISIEKNIIFIFFSYLLTKFSKLNEFGISESINYEGMSDLFQVSRSYSKKIILFYQKKLSEFSCEFIKSLSINIKSQKILPSLLDKMTFRSENNRMVMPCYLVSKIIFFHILENNKIIKLNFFNGKILDEFCLFIKPNDEKNDFEIIRNLAGIRCKFSLEMWVYGDINQILCLKNKSTKFRSSLKKIIMANQSAHPQFSGKKLQILNNNPFLYCMNNNLTQLESELFLNRNYSPLNLFDFTSQCHLNSN